MKWTPRTLRFILNIYGPYLGAGVKVSHIDPSWRELHVSMKLKWYNRNAVGTHFGGSLYAMVDPHLMLLLMKLLGTDYVIWDKAAEIEFIKPGQGPVQAIIRITEADLAQIHRQTAGGNTFLPEFEIQVVDRTGDLVVRVRKVLYIRKKAPGIKPPDR